MRKVVYSAFWLLFSASILLSQNVGIGTALPGAKFTVNGAWASTPVNLVAGAAPLVPTNVTHIRLTNDAAVAANAIAAPATAADGQLLNIVNDDAQAATFAGVTILAAGGAASFIFINGTWRPLGTTTAWNLLGNAGTVAGTNFVGTIDNVPLQLRINNVQSGLLTTSGETTFGYQAGLVNTSASTTAIGYQALLANTSALNNTALGGSTLTANTDGTANTAIGVYALTANTLGDRNTALGVSALRLNTTGASNTAMGSSTLLSNQTGTNNAGLGYSVLDQNTTGNNNVAIGTLSGGGNINGSNNTFLGYNADANADNLTNATAIGANSVVAQSNTVILGNGANVGIGTNTPNAALQLGNTIANRCIVIYEDANNDHQYYGLGINPSMLRYQIPASTAVHAFFRGNSSAASTELMRIQGNGNVGIGTNLPVHTLHVAGTAGKTAGLSWTVVSDARLKQNVTNFQPGLAELMQLRTVNYEFRPDNALGIKSQGSYVGFIAQEVQRVLPMAVNEMESGYLELNSDPILWTMLNSIQQQQRTIEAQNTQLQLQTHQLQQQQTQINALMGRLDALAPAPSAASAGR
jgi:Chaperone of endosialidase